MQLTGAEVMVKCLEEEGVSTIFGYPGGAILPFYNALRDVKNIKHVLTAHEQGAAHAADGYARASGKVGVCCATSGPGATNLVTGLANAFLDSIPVVAITGQVKSSMIGHDALPGGRILPVLLCRLPSKIFWSISRKNWHRPCAWLFRWPKAVVRALCL